MFLYYIDVLSKERRSNRRLGDSFAEPTKSGWLLIV